MDTVNTNFKEKAIQRVLQPEGVLTFVDVPEEKLGLMRDYAKKLMINSPKMKWNRVARKVADKFNIKLEYVKEDENGTTDKVDTPPSEAKIIKF